MFAKFFAVPDLSDVKSLFVILFTEPNENMHRMFDISMISSTFAFFVILFLTYGEKSALSALKLRSEM